MVKATAAFTACLNKSITHGNGLARKSAVLCPPKRAGYRFFNGDLALVNSASFSLAARAQRGSSLSRSAS